MIDNTLPDEEADETQDLLVRIQGGDTHAFDELFARHRAEVHRAVARRIEPSLRSRVDPSDVVQEAQMDAAERLSDFIARRPMPFRLWMVRTAVERLLKFRRQATAARRDAGRDRPLAVQSGSSRGTAGLAAVSARILSPSQQAAAVESARKLHDALGRLSDPDRAILQLRALDGLSYEAAAARLDIEPAAARKRYGRALLRLRAMLMAEGLTESHL